MFNKGSKRKSSECSSVKASASLYSDIAWGIFFSIIAIPASAFKATTTFLSSSSPSTLVLPTRTYTKEVIFKYTYSRLLSFEEIQSYVTRQKDIPTESLPWSWETVVESAAQNFPLVDDSRLVGASKVQNAQKRLSPAVPSNKLHGADMKLTTSSLAHFLEADEFSSVPKPVSLSPITLYPYLASEVVTSGRSHAMTLIILFFQSCLVLSRRVSHASNAALKISTLILKDNKLSRKVTAIAGLNVKNFKLAK
nr:hypothetical protein Iba_chr02dCG16680 [Ipomoea batatas]